MDHIADEPKEVPEAEAPAAEEAPAKKPAKMRKPQKATPPPKGKVYKRFKDDAGRYYWKYM